MYKISIMLVPNIGRFTEACSVFTVEESLFWQAKWKIFFLNRNRWAVAWIENIFSGTYQVLVPMENLFLS